jgi:hypothetical protein
MHTGCRPDSHAMPSHAMPWCFLVLKSGHWTEKRDMDAGMIRVRRVQYLVHNGVDGYACPKQFVNGLGVVCRGCCSEGMPCLPAQVATSNRLESDG